MQNQQNLNSKQNSNHLLTVFFFFSNFSSLPLLHFPSSLGNLLPRRLCPSVSFSFLRGQISSRVKARVFFESRMGQQTLIYSFVARGTVILVEYTEFSGNFTTIASQCLQKLPASNNKFTYNCDGHTFNYLVENGFSEFISSSPCISHLSSRLVLIRVC